MADDGPVTAERAYLKAMAKAQDEMKVAAFDSVNPHFKSKYASFASVREAVKVIHKYGFCFKQRIYQDSGVWFVETKISHELGHAEFSTFPFFLPPNPTNQQVGSANTYAKRYGLCNALGVVADHDDDGNESSQRKPEVIKPEIAKHLPLKENRILPSGNVHVGVTELVEANEKAEKVKTHVEDFYKQNPRMKELGDWKFPLNGPSQGKTLKEIKIEHLGKICDTLKLRPELTDTEQMTVLRLDEYLKLAKELLK